MVPVSDPEVPAQLLASIYEAACEPGRWPEVLAQITLWVSGELGAGPQGLEELQGVVLLHQTHWTIALASFGRLGRELYQHVRTKLDAVAPHVNRALAMGHGFEGARTSDPALLLAQRMALVDVLQVDRGLRVLHAGQSTRRGLSQEGGGPLVISKRLLRGRVARDHALLVDAVAEALRGHSSNLSLGTAEARMFVGVAPGPWLSPIGHERSVSLVLPPDPRREVGSADTSRFASLPSALQGVAEGLAEGLTDKEIAVSLGLPLTTARTYVARVLKRLGVNGRRELMRPR